MKGALHYLPARQPLQLAKPLGRIFGPASHGDVDRRILPAAPSRTLLRQSAKHRAQAWCSLRQMLGAYDLLMMPTTPMKATPLPPPGAPIALNVQRAYGMLEKDAFRCQRSSSDVNSMRYCPMDCWSAVCLSANSGRNQPSTKRLPPLKARETGRRCRSGSAGLPSCALKAWPFRAGSRRAPNR